MADNVSSSSSIQDDFNSEQHEPVLQQVPSPKVRAQRPKQDAQHTSRASAYFVEFCAGSAALSAEARKAGFRVLPLDHSHNRHRTLATTVQLDLAAESSIELVDNMLHELRSLAAHYGLPCGTCSRARDKELPKRLQGSFTAPPPLRSAEHLMGLPHLTGVNLAKVTQANKLYANAVVFLYTCYVLGIGVSVENPQRSWLWGVLLQLVKGYNDAGFLQWYTSLERVDFHACMHGSKRAKKTRLLATAGLFTTLAAECDGGHEHMPWTIEPQGRGLKFATADEAQYPTLLCVRMVQCLVHSATEAGLQLVSQPTKAQQTRHSLGNQTIKSKPLVPEFQQFIHTECEIATPGHKLLASPLPGGTNTEMPASKRVRKTFKYGVQWRPEEFLEQAKLTSHPRSPQKMLPDYMKEAMFQVLTTTAVEAAKHRLQVILAVRAKCNELKTEEHGLKQRLDPEAKAVLSSKHITLWRYLLQATGFDDMEVVDLVSAGIPLHGSHSVPPNFPADWKPAEYSVDELRATAEWRRRVIMAASSDMTREQEDDLKQATDKEVELGHLAGPLDERQMTEHFGTATWLLNPRFVRYQGEERKVRPIDDCSRSGLNGTYTTNFRLELFDSDTLACVIAVIADSLEERKVCFDMQDGSELSGNVHASLHGSLWSGRTLDLSRAYKQLAVDVHSRPVNIVGFKYRNKWLFYRSNVLPFGSTASVYAFNRVSRSLHFLLCKLLWTVATCFYDDFPVVSPTESAGILSKSMTALLDMLGWDHAKLGTKAADFASDFNALGIQVQLANLHRGSFIMANKPGRVERIVRMLEQVAKDGVITKSKAAEVQGHLNFAVGFYTAKTLKFLVSAFDKLADLPASMSAADLRDLAMISIAMLQGTAPRKYNASSFRPPMLFFTDAAWDDGRSSAGAVVHDPTSNETTVFEVEIPEDLQSMWLEDVGDQIVTQLEFFTYLAVRVKYIEELHNRLAISWIDNESARVACIKGSSQSFSLQAMTRVLQQVELEKPSLMWYERVASYSNPSDMPSRGKTAAAAKLFNARPLEPWSCPRKIVDAIKALHRKPFSLLPELTS